jgi:hypothetical protein
MRMLAAIVGAMVVVVRCCHALHFSFFFLLIAETGRRRRHGLYLYVKRRKRAVWVCVCGDCRQCATAIRLDDTVYALAPASPLVLLDERSPHLAPSFRLTARQDKPN